MSISKRKYNPFRIEDMTGGINVRDYASEIEDKQAVHINDWNFSGNKLVSDKGVSDTLLPSNSLISAIKIDSGDVWTIADNKIFKDGVEKVSKNGARLKVSGVSKTLYKDVYDINGELLTKQLTSEEYFPDGVYYYIEVNSVEYKVMGVSVEDIYTNLSSLLISDGYTTSISNNYLYISYSSPIIVTAPSYNTYVAYLKNTISFTDPKWEDRWVRGFVYSINGLNERPIFNTRDATTASINYNVGAMDRYIRDQLYTDIDSLGLDIDITKTYLSQGFSNDGTGTIVGEEFDNGYASIIIQKATDLSFYDEAIDLDGNRYNPSMFIIGDLTSFYNDPDATFKIRYGKPDEVSIVIADVLATYPLLSNGDALRQWFLDNGYPNTPNWVVGRYDVFGNTYPSAFGLYPLDVNGKSCAPLSVQLVSATVADEGSWYKLEEDAFNISTNTFENNTINSILPVLGKTNLTIGNLGQLIVNKDDGGAYYYTDNLMYEITQDEVGLPTVGTIYNGKIVLGGYSDNDNIVFSQTSTPSQPLNLLNFEDYSAGGQSISGGDKGLVTGMIVGENGLYVFKDNSIWYSNSEKDNSGSLSFNLVFNKITSNGVLSQNVITEVDQEILYLDWKNRAVRRLGYEQNLTTLRDVSISREISDLLQELPEDQSMATSHFSYPYYQLSLSNGQNSSIEYNNGKTYKTNNIHFVYNVENKSWTTRTGIDNVIVSDKGYFASLDGSVYKDFNGNTTQEGVYTSKEYTFGDDIMYKKYGRFEIVGRINPEDGFTKTLTVEIWIDGEKIDEREYNSDTLTQVKEKIDLFDIGQTFQFKIKHSGKGSVEVFDTQVYYKGTNIQPQDYS